jgi:outer membrane protein assembly factor BamB
MSHLMKSTWALAICSTILCIAGCGGGNSTPVAPPAAAVALADINTGPSALNFQTVGTLAKAAAFNGDGLTIDKNGNVYVGTSKGGTIYKVTPTGQSTLFATFPAGATANGSDFDSKGNLYVANEAQNIVHKITPEGVVSNFATNLDGPAGIYVDENDNVIVGLYGDLVTKAIGSKVIMIAQDKSISTVASGNGLLNVVGVAGDGRGRYFAANFKNGELFEITGGIVKQISAGGVRVNHMKYYGGYLYMPNPLDHVIRRSDLNGKMEQLAGIKGTASSLDGPVATATFARPNSIDISADGKTVYILEFDTGHVRTITATK